MPSDIHRNYGNAVSAIYRDMGRARAEARLQQGQGWANAIGNIGQTIANIPGQMAEQKQQQMRSALTDLQMQEVKANLERAKQQDAQTMAIANLVSQATVNGQFDKDAFSTAAAADGMGQIVPEVIKTFAESERALIELEDAQKRGQVTDATLAKLQQDYLRPFALQLWENKFDPTVVNGAFAAMKAQGVPDELLSQWQSMPPEQMSLMVQQLLPSRPAPKAVTLSKDEVLREPVLNQYGQPVLDEQGQPTFDIIEGPKTQQTLEQQLAAAVASRNGAEVARIRNEMARAAAATRAPREAAQPSYQWVTMPDGTQKLMSAEEIRATPGAAPPSASRSADAPAAVKSDLASIGTLSDMLTQIETIGKENKWEGIGGMGSGSLQDFMKKQFGTGSEKGQNLRNTISNVLAEIAKLRGGTAFTAQEQQLLERYTPTISESPASVAGKVKSLREFLAIKKRNIEQQFMGNTPAPSGGRASGAGPAAGGGTPAPMSAEALLKKYGGG